MEHKNNIKQNPFKVPENYFEDLPSRIQEKINAKQEVPIKSMKTVIFNAKVLAAASLILILGLASIFIFQLNEPVNNTTDPIALEEFNTVSDYLITDLDADELMQAYVEMTNESDYSYLISAEDLDEQEIIDYLLQDDLIEYYLLDEI